MCHTYPNDHTVALAIKWGSSNRWMIGRTKKPTNYMFLPNPGTVEPPKKRGNVKPKFYMCPSC